MYATKPPSRLTARTLNRQCLTLASNDRLVYEMASAWTVEPGVDRPGTKPLRCPPRKAPPCRPPVSLWRRYRQPAPVLLIRASRTTGIEHRIFQTVPHRQREERLWVRKPVSWPALDDQASRRRRSRPPRLFPICQSTGGTVRWRMSVSRLVCQLMVSIRRNPSLHVAKPGYLKPNLSPLRASAQSAR